MKILADATLPGLVKAFPKPFELTLYHQQNAIPALLKDQEILLCRSTLPVNEALLTGHSLRYVATASSGTDHIDTIYLQKKAIQLLDAKGSNAVAVADYVIATLAYLQKFKNFSGVTAGVIGMGEVGSRVAKRLAAAGMRVCYYDPFKTQYENSLTKISQCELISIHANLHDQNPFPSRNLFAKKMLDKLPENAVIINAARGGIVNEAVLLQQKKPLTYCTDVYLNEPLINREIVNFATLCTPHIAGHSIEAKYNAVWMISQKLHAYFQLKPPILQHPPINQPIQQNGQAWQDLILSLYNPMIETLQLKQAINLEQTFLNLRKLHQNRHDFYQYSESISEEQIKDILRC